MDILPYRTIVHDKVSDDVDDGQAVPGGVVRASSYMVCTQLQVSVNSHAWVVSVGLVGDA